MFMHFYSVVHLYLHIFIFYMATVACYHSYGIQCTQCPSFCSVFLCYIGSSETVRLGSNVWHRAFAGGMCMTQQNVLFVMALQSFMWISWFVDQIPSYWVRCHDTYSMTVLYMSSKLIVGKVCSFYIGSIMPFSGSTFIFSGCTIISLHDLQFKRLEWTIWTTQGTILATETIRQLFLCM